MKKRLTLSVLAFSASLAYAGSCGGGYGKDKKGDKSGLTQPAVSIACVKSSGDDTKESPPKTGFTESANALACGTAGDGKGKSGKLTDSTVIGETA